MTSNQNRKNQAGAALLLAIFALALVSAIGLAMLFASDTETSISANYRDKQTAIYGALSGLQEARDRIQPKKGDLAAAGLVPTSLPVAGGKNVVLYIINPQNGEDVRPWDAGNKYFDTELCQEQALGLSGTPGVPCGPSDIPAGTDWFRVYDNSANETIWKLKNTSGTPVPLSYKWVRVTLKADNAAPLKIPDATKATGKQLCWDGLHQLPLPAGYKSDCTPPSDGVVHIRVTNGGSGYAPSSAVNVKVAAPPGGGATAIADNAKLETSSTGQIGSLTLTDGGKGYTTPPSVVITGDGTGATGHALLGGSPIVSATLSNAGSPVPGCYDAAAAENLKVAFSGVENSGSGAAATVTVTGPRCVIGWSATGSCNSKKKENVTVSGTGGSGTQFTGTIAFDASGNAVSGSSKVLSPGDYSSLPTGTNLPNGCQLNYSFTPGVQISKVTLTNGGDYYVDPVTAMIAGATQLGNAPVISANASGGTNAGKVTSLVLDNRGSGYSSATVTIAAPVGAGTQQATGTASVAQVTSVSGVTVTYPGSGYKVAPIVTIDPPAGGVPATAVAVLGNGGGYFGQVYLITSFAETPSGARAMAQMEVATTYDQFTFNLGGALTLAGPKPTYDSPSSQNLMIDGNDHAGSDALSCKEDKYPPRPAIGVYDDPNHQLEPGEMTAVATVLAALAKPDNYIGANGTKDVANVFNSLGDSATVAGLKSFVNNSILPSATNTYNYDPGDTLNAGTPQNPVVAVVNGDLTLSGNPQGYGTLLVTGTLNLKGNFDWHGLVFVIGEGAAVLKGGGNMNITGAMFVANTATPNDTTPGSPSVQWSGGGNNSITYDHCWADNLLKQFPVSPTVSPNALRVLSTRMLEY